MHIFPQIIKNMKANLPEFVLTTSKVHSKISLGWVPNMRRSRNTLSTVYRFMCCTLGCWAKYRANDSLKSYGKLVKLPKRVMSATAPVSTMPTPSLGAKKGVLKYVPPCSRKTLRALSASVSMNACCQAVLLWNDRSSNVISSAVDIFYGTIFESVIEKTKMSLTLGRCENIFWRAQHIMAGADSDNDEHWMNAAIPTAKARYVCVRRCYAEQASKKDYGKILTHVNLHPNPNWTSFKMFSHQKLINFVIQN